jgi:apolipoprotein N-acyltransferase
MNRVQKIFGVVTGAVGGFFPLLALAANADTQATNNIIGSGVSTNLDLSGSGTIWNILDGIYALMGKAIPFLVAIAVLYFLFSALRFVMNADDAEKRKSGSDGMIYGIIGIVVMLSFWGLIGVILKSFGLEGGANSAVIPGLANPAAQTNIVAPTGVTTTR